MVRAREKHNRKSPDFRKWSQVRGNLISFEVLREKTTQIQSFTKVCAIKESRFVQERSVLFSSQPIRKRWTMSVLSLLGEWNQYNQWSQWRQTPRPVSFQCVSKYFYNFFDRTINSSLSIFPTKILPKRFTIKVIPRFPSQ